MCDDDDADEEEEYSSCDSNSLSYNLIRVALRRVALFLNLH
ncbi:hypothetical protein DFA_08718 [Cavenderia fasciculata]|uniref:Uncharacterized protein n=1 Tax=Cavenderia fasciculata TaxID=261658 RepID=F4Q3W4_CACFS|nr:uncharacterized protein DFA_08718 [Cavenderia fasciculata]EGG17720.1 hypothetical protein DFA_08718 [Cavenderia fasciculata]|eukprot:XP_004356204.1 hypothetical protein DFA_08718 [Cavenderia fasciculata]